MLGIKFSLLSNMPRLRTRKYHGEHSFLNNKTASIAIEINTMQFAHVARM